jgi:hypothetical protein
MIRQGVVILVVVAVSCFAYCQDRNGSTIRESTQAHCELNQDDYAVFAALLKGLHGPEDPEEAWEGKEMLILDVTATPAEPEKQASGWGFRSKSNASPSQETFQDYAEKAHDVCEVKPEFGDPQSYKIIPKGQTDAFFRKDGDGWKGFYKTHPKSAGYWQLSRPG